MKFLFVALITFALNQSQSASSFFTSKVNEVVWLGIDYSHCKVIGPMNHFFGAGEQSANTLRDKYFPAWNYLVLNERKKYFVKEMLRKESVYYDIDSTMKTNSLTDLNTIEAVNAPNYTSAQVTTFAEGLKSTRKKGVGVAFIAESMNKHLAQGVYHFVAVDLSTNQVLFTEKVSGKAGGFGVRNYWGGSIARAMRLIKSSHYSQWKSKYKK